MDLRQKQPGEARGYNFDFGPRLPAGRRLQLVDPIVQAVHRAPAGVVPEPLVVSGLAYSPDGTKVQARIGGGTHGTTYKLTALAIDDAGDCIALVGLLRVQEE